MPALLSTSVSQALIALSLVISCARPRTTLTVESPPSARLSSAVANAPAPREPRRLDGDRDGVPDADDACPDLAEDRDDFADEDGCPDRDNDGDGIPDAHEWTGERWTNCDRQLQGGAERDCRNLPETFDGYRDQDGCPDLLEAPCTVTVSVYLHYDPRTLKFHDEDLARLSEIFDYAAEYPYEFVDVWGYANRGRDPLGARRRSMRAAERARDELIRRGLTAERIRAGGQGHPREFGKPEDNYVVVFNHYRGAGPMECL